MPRDRESIRDILDSIELIARYVSGKQREEFEEDVQCQDAVIRRFEVIGEAVKRVSEDTRSRFSQIPWKDMAGMRDRVIHGYDTVDLGIVWETIHRDLPTVAEQLKTALETEGWDSAETA